MTMGKPGSSQINGRIMSWESRTATAEDDYEAKVLLIQRAFCEISRLCFEYDCALSPQDWWDLDSSRLDAPALSFQELRERLVRVYRRIKRACAEKLTGAGKSVSQT